MLITLVDWVVVVVVAVGVLDNALVLLSSAGSLLSSEVDEEEELVVVDGLGDGKLLGWDGEEDRASRRRMGSNELKGE